MKINKINFNKKFDEFFIEYHPKIKAFSLRILLSESDAEDVTQDIFTKLLDHPEIWNQKIIPDGYIFTMTKNLIFNRIKRQKIERKYQEDLITRKQMLAQFSIVDELHAKELKEIAINAVENMPPQRKLIFKMSRLEGKSNEKISTNLNLSIRTVERHIYLALSDLKKALYL